MHSLVVILFLQSLFIVPVKQDLPVLIKGARFESVTVVSECYQLFSVNSLFLKSIGYILTTGGTFLTAYG